jgi:L-seryl-tRNA(Ser) seleniumtransferase
MGTQVSLRDLPAVDRLLAEACWEQAEAVPPSRRRAACRQVLESLRLSIRAGDLQELPALSDLAAQALAHAGEEVRSALRAVVNATGVVLHTNLGRAPLAPAAIEAIGRLAGGYSNLEIDLDSGARDSRNRRLLPSLARVLGAPDVAVVNNNAAAVYLALCALASDGVGVAVSRGELVEIGGSFRMPDIMAASGARLLEVGTTNRTRLDDYQRALDAGAKILLKVHRSNFAMVGFTEEPELAELVDLAHRYEALVIYDLGSGLLRATEQLREDSVSHSLEVGADLVLFSGDKLLGGPQAGLIAGDTKLLDRIRRHPIARMLRPGKLTFLALEATLLAWERDPSGGEVPAARLCRRSAEDLDAQAHRLADSIGGLAITGLTAEIVAVESTPGGGSSALLRLPSSAVALSSSRVGEDKLASELRCGVPAVLTRIEHGRVLLDVRTLLEGDFERVLTAIQRLS